MSIDPGINDLLEGGAKSISWNGVPVGTTVRGAVVSARKIQQTEYGTRKPKFYDDGNPMMQIVINIRTDRSEEDDDDGVRSLYVKGQMLQALREALRAAKAELAEGGDLAVQITGTEPSNFGNPKNLFKMQYRAPAAKAITVDDLFE